jgi:predicted RNA-binding Zn-ribbon protein involved in translation (DUF1610 family)
MSQAPQPTRCQNCGGMMNPQWDGRTYVCPYCGVQIQVAIGADQIARGMALDLSDMDAFLSRLAETLRQGFSEHSRIEANGARVESIEVNLEPDVFLVRREGARPIAQHRRVVRGIALKTNTIPLDRWLDMLTNALAQHANQNARAAWVLGQLTGGNR